MKESLKMKHSNNVLNSKAERGVKRFDEEFKREVVALLKAGRSATKLSKELGVSTWSLCQWKKRFGSVVTAAHDLPRSAKALREGEASPVALADEVVRLRAELYAVSRQRDILKKALGILSQESQDATH
jgi:transposase-like protein